MKPTLSILMLTAALAFAAVTAHADEYTDTISTFKQAGKSAHFYAVFPTVGISPIADRQFAGLQSAH